MPNTHLARLKSALVRPMAGGAWLSEVDGLRFIAIFTVVLQHLLERFARRSPLDLPHPVIDDQFAFFISRGTVGVFLFFAISGFVLALPFAKTHLLDAPKTSLRAFYARRLTRLEPPYIVWMTVFALVLLAKGAYSLPELFPHWLASITYTHVVFWPNDYSPINPVTWSLEIEVQFYLLAPFLSAAYFGIRDARRRRIGLLVFTAGWLLLQHYMGWWFFPGRNTLAGHLQHFLVGFLIADLYLTEWRKGAPQHRIWDWLAPLAYVAMCYTWTTELWKNFAFTAALLVLFMAAFRGVAFRRMLQNHWVAAFGGMCYTIYLMHLPLLEALVIFTAPITLTDILWVNFVLQTLLCLPVVAVASALFFLVLEKPFMRKRAPGEPIYKLPKVSLSSIYKKNAPAKPPIHAPEFLKNKPLIALLLASAAAANLQAQTAVAAPPPAVRNTQTPVVQSPPVQTLDIVDIAADSTADGPMPLDSIRLRPLPDLIAAALSLDPGLKANRVDSDKQFLAWQVQKRGWADLISVNGGGAYGNGLLTEAQAADNGTVTVSTGRLSTTVTLGLNIRVTGGDVLTRRQRTQIQKLQLDRLQHERTAIEMDIRKEVTALYCQVELALSVVRLKYEALENVRIAVGLAEKYFREGQLQLGEYSTMLGKMTAAEEECVKAKMEAKKLSLDLQLLVGSTCWR